LDAFHAALRIDPDNAEAHAGLAKTFILLREYTLMPDAQAYPLARDAARRAIALDATLPDAHAALAFVEYWSFWDADAAERAFELAITLRGGGATAHHWYATFLSARGRFAEAVTAIERALRIAPSSLAAQADRGLLLFHAGRTEKAVAELERLANEHPDLCSAHRYLSAVYLLTGRDRDYLREARTTAVLVHDHAQLSALGAAQAALAAAGRDGMLSALVAARMESARSGMASAYSVALLSALAGDHAAALTWLQKSLDKREADFIQIVFEPALRGGLAGDPAFESLAAQVKPAVREGSASAPGLGDDLSVVLNRSPHAMILLGPDHRVRFANDAAARLFSESCGLLVRGGRLTAERPEDGRRLQALVARAALPDDGGSSGWLAVQASSRHLPLSVTVAPLRPDRSEPPGPEPSILVCVTNLDAQAAPPVQQLREMFGLTPAEARLALALFEGLTPAEAAANAGLSIYTVRVQLARIFEKTGVSRQSGLMRLMMRTVGTPLL
jgi:DNA-binding CsgD family transcriptional regulator/tetratricopeptide (TPR) repeat protein